MDICSMMDGILKSGLCTVGLQVAAGYRVTSVIVIVRVLNAPIYYMLI